MMSNGADGRYLIGWVFSGTGGPPLRDTLVEVRNRKIVRCLPAASGEFPIDHNWSRSTIVPGLIDAHVHLGLPQTPPMESASADGHQRSSIVAIEQRLMKYLACGIVGVRDAGDRSGAVSRWRHHGNASTQVPVVVRSAGTAWHRPGRYGGFIGRTPLSDLASAIQSNLAHVDHIKIIQSGINSLTEFGRITPPQFSLVELQHAVRTAHQHGTPVMVHANGPEPVLAAIEAGCDSIEHGYFMDDACLTAMADRGTTWVPTLAPIHAITESPDADPSQRNVARRMLEHQFALIRRARSLGIFIAVGTDAGGMGVVHGDAVALEMSLLMNAGLSVSETIAAGTSTGAMLLGLESGRLETGAPATFIQLKGSPEDIPTSLACVQQVVIEGRVVHRAINGG